MSMPSVYGNPTHQHQQHSRPTQQHQYAARAASQGGHMASQQAPDYSAYTTQPPPQSYVSHANASPSIGHGHMPTQSLTTSSPYQRGYDEPHPSMPDMVKSMPEIAGYFPREGPSGSPFTVILHSALDLTSDSRTFNIMFGSRRVKPSLQRQASAHGVMSQFALSAAVPSLGETGWFVSRVTVYLNVEDENGEELGTLEVGEFKYTDAKVVGYSASPQVGGARKRKSSLDPEDADIVSHPAKRTSTLTAKGPLGEEDYSSFSHSRQSGQSYSGYGGFEQSDTSTPYSDARRPNVQPPVSLPSPSNTPQPSLVRTSSLAHAGQTQDPATVGSAGPGGQPFNPYAMYPNKAVLKVVGDLDSMATQWTSEEWDNRRRLVQFWRQQKGSTIHTMFQPVSPSERPANSICISCIWWAEKSECYVTSVDTIYLLEALIAVRFTVEEKNRIRRNLEGFRPLTVSKAKPECESFFKLIMSFPNPKPRNIEKDVKVFPWKILSHALKKIIGKYSASYSSTASALPLPAPDSSYPGGSPSRSPGQVSNTESSHMSVTSPPIGEASSAPVSRPSSGPSPLGQSQRLPPPPTSAYLPGPPELQLHVPPTAVSASMWQQQVQPTLGGSRQSFDLSAFLETSPQTASPGNPQALAYSRGGMMQMDSKDDLTRRDGRP